MEDAESGGAFELALCDEFCDLLGCGALGSELERERERGEKLGKNTAERAKKRERERESTYRGVEGVGGDRAVPARTTELQRKTALRAAINCNETVSIRERERERESMEESSTDEGHANAGGLAPL